MSDINKPILRDTKKEIIPEFTLHKKYLDQIKSGLKIAEGRINSGAFKNVQPDSKIKFFDGKNPQSYVICKIISVRKYSTFRNMLVDLGINNMLPGISDIDKAVKIYDDIPGYRERCRMHGCLGLEIQVIEQK